MRETQEKWATHQNGPSPHLKYHLQLKTKEDVGGGALTLQRGGRQFTRSRKSKCLVNKCLLGLHRKQDTRWSLISRACRVSPTIPHPYSLQISLVRALFWEQRLHLNSSRQLGGRSKFLPESLGPWLFSAQSCMPKRYILGWQILLSYNSLKI